MNILIVDDDSSFLAAIQKKLHWEQLGISEILIAPSVVKAKKILSAKPIDLLMTDIEMPGQSGLELLRWNKENCIPCISIILSSFPDFHYAQKAISLGVFEYLLKTVDEHILENVIYRAVMQICARKAAQEISEPSYETPKAKQLKQYISEHISETISRDEIASYAGFTPEYLSAFFKKEVGLTLTDYINQEKIRFAQKLLAQTDLPISMIAQNIGFDSASYFTMLFRKTTGYTPREFRKQRRGI